MKKLAGFFLIGVSLQVLVLAQDSGNSQADKAPPSRTTYILAGRPVIDRVNVSKQHARLRNTAYVSLQHVRVIRVHVSSPKTAAYGTRLLLPLSTSRQSRRTPTQFRATRNAK